MARSRPSNTPSPPQNNQNILDVLLSKINGIGGALLILFGVGGGCYQVGRVFMENEKNVEFYDFKIENQNKVDSLKKKIEDCDCIKSKTKKVNNGKK